MRLNPGSILWVPQAGVRAVPVELATAPVVSVTRERKAGFDVIELEAALGRVQIDHDAGLFEMVQEEVAEMAASQPPGDPSAPMG